MAQNNRTVIGNYADREGAQISVKKLKDIGYTNEDITVYANREFGDVFENVQTVNIKSQPNEDVIHQYRDEISSGNIVVVVDDQSDNISDTTGNQPDRDRDLTDNDEEADASSRGFGPDTVGGISDKASGEDNFNADAIDPREVSSDDIHSSKVTERGMNTNPTGESATRDIEDQTGDIGSENRTLPIDDIGQNKDNNDTSEDLDAQNNYSESSVQDDNENSDSAEGGGKKPVDKDDLEKNFKKGTDKTEDQQNSQNTNH